MKLTFLGATHQVTGSCTLLEWLPGRYAIIDYGMEQGENNILQKPLPVPPGKVEYVFLTHAHIDHSGLLPLLYKNGFRGQIYATEETVNLADIMLRDSAQIQETDAAYQTKKNLRTDGPEVKPLYTVEDAEQVMRCFYPCEYKKIYMVDEGISVRFTDAGHLLGSAFIEMFLEENGERRTMVFSGDVGNLHQPIIRDPEPVPEADYLLIESTYGTKIHDPMAAPIPLLTEILRKTFSRRGTVIIPSFAVGRTQELLYFFREIKQRKLLPSFNDFSVYVDSPLADKATAVFLQCGVNCLDDEARAILKEGENPIWFNGLHTLCSVEDSRKLNENHDIKVIIASGGMCEGGRIRHHLKHGLWNNKNTVLFAGYQAVGTLGRAIFDGMKQVKILGESIDVNADIALLGGISGHADQKGLLHWIEQFERKPQRVFVNHGEDESCSAFADLIQEYFAIPAEAPCSGSCFDLIRGDWDTKTEIVYRDPGKSEPRPAVNKGGARNQMLFEELNDAAEELMNRVRQMKGHSNQELENMNRRIRNLLENAR